MAERHGARIGAGGEEVARRSIGRHVAAIGDRAARGLGTRGCRNRPRDPGAGKIAGRRSQRGHRRALAVWRGTRPSDWDPRPWEDPSCQEGPCCEVGGAVSANPAGHPIPRGIFAADLILPRLSLREGERGAVTGAVTWEPRTNVADWTGERRLGSKGG